MANMYLKTEPITMPITGEGAKRPTSCALACYACPIAEICSFIWRIHQRAGKGRSKNRPTKPVQVDSRHLLGGQWFLNLFERFIFFKPPAMLVVCDYFIPFHKYDLRNRLSLDHGVLYRTLYTKTPITPMIANTQAIMQFL